MMEKVDKYDGTNFERVAIQLLSNIQDGLQRKITKEELRIIEQQAVIIKLTELLLNKEVKKDEG